MQAGSMCSWILYLRTSASSEVLPGGRTGRVWIDRTIRQSCCIESCCTPPSLEMSSSSTAQIYSNMSPCLRHGTERERDDLLTVTDRASVAHASVLLALLLLSTSLTEPREPTRTERQTCRTRLRVFRRIRQRFDESVQSEESEADALGVRAESSELDADDADLPYFVYLFTSFS
jgi:hypothetical protein